MKNNDHKKVGRAGWSDEDHTERFDVNEYADEIVNSEVSTGKKKSKKKKHKKSDHKHEFVEVILREESVSPFDEEALSKLANDEKKYKKIPFLYLIASNSRNDSIKWADKNLTYINKKVQGSWMIYCFRK